MNDRDKKRVDYYKTVIGYVNGDTKCEYELKQDNFKSIGIAFVGAIIGCTLIALAFTAATGFSMDAFLTNTKTCLIILGAPLIFGVFLEYLFPYLDDHGHYYGYGGIFLVAILQNIFGIVASTIIVILVEILFIIKLEKPYKEDMKKNAMSKLSDILKNNGIK